MRTLLEISKDLEALERLLGEVDMSIAAAEGEVTPEREEALAAIDQWKKTLGEEFDTKIDNIAALVRCLDLRASARREEKERLEKRVRVDENNAKWLKDMVKMELETRNIKKLETRRYKIGVAGNGGLAPLVIDISATMPPEYAVQPPPEWNKKKLREDLEAGGHVDGVQLLPRGTHLSIR